MANVVAEKGEGMHKGLAVRVQLGRGHVDFGQKSALEPRERKAKLVPLEDSGVHKEEGFLSDENQLKVAFYNEEQDHSPSHLKFFLLIFAKDKAQAQA